jgi:hypothetical protein
MQLREFWTPTRVLRGRHPLHHSYPLLPGDLLVYSEERQVWAKEAPGLQIEGFEVDALRDDLQAVRVWWTSPLTYIYAATHPSDEVMVEAGFIPPPPPVPKDIKGEAILGTWSWNDGKARWEWALAPVEQDEAAE